jgi:hypothetical protein
MEPLLEPPLPFAAPPRLPRRREPWVAVVLGLLVPGLGHVYARRPAKAAWHVLAIFGLFVTGLSLTGWTAVHPRKHPLEFAAHAWMGLPTVVAWQYGERFFLEEMPRWMEIGRLFVAIAGLLNVVAVCDALGEVVSHNVRVEAARRVAAPPLLAEVPLAPEEANGLASPLRDEPLPAPAPEPEAPATDRLPLFDPPARKREDPPPPNVFLLEPPPPETSPSEASPSEAPPSEEIAPDEELALEEEGVPETETAPDEETP